MSGYVCRIKITHTPKFYCLPITECPIKGQIYYPECAPCDGTCENPNPPCPAICKPGCACPRGEVILGGKQCVHISQCPRPPGDMNVILYTICVKSKLILQILNCCL